MMTVYDAWLAIDWEKRPINSHATILLYEYCEATERLGSKRRTQCRDGETDNAGQGEHQED